MMSTSRFGVIIISSLPPKLPLEKSSSVLRAGPYRGWFGSCVEEPGYENGKVENVKRGNGLFSHN